MSARRRITGRLLAVAAIPLVVTTMLTVRAGTPSEEERATPAWAARNAGTLDGHARALLERASDEPVTLGIRAVRRRLSFERLEAADEHIAFRLPAGAFSLIDFDDLLHTNQRIGWELWHRSLDPVRPDTAADQAACSSSNLACLASGRVAARRAAGECVLRVELTGVIGVEEERQRVLWVRSGMREHLFTRTSGPCAYRDDPVLGLLATAEAHDIRDIRACNLGGLSPHVTPQGRRYLAANFLKLESDGRARFSVRCHAHIHSVPDSEARYCELQGYLGQWPLFMWVLSNRAAEWDETFLRVRDHLARHVVSRTDAPQR